MKKLMMLGLALTAGSTLVAAPQVSGVALSQSGGTVTINYTLSVEPGIVTVDVQTNAGDNVWVSIGPEHLTHFAGDVNKRVDTGSHTITWKPRKAWPDNKVTENVKAVVSAWALNAPPDYMVVSLVSSHSVEFYTSSKAVPFGVTNDLYKTDYLVLRKIPAANVRWRMGSPATPAEKGRTAARETPHEVMLADDYYMGIYPVTQRQYERMMNSRPSRFKLDSDYMTRPVDQISYEAIRGTAGAGYNWPENEHAVLSTSFMGVLRSFTGLDGFDLPTEAQWEFACRAGCGAALYNGKELEDTSSSGNLNQLARYKANGGYENGGTTSPDNNCTADNGTAKVGSFEQNAWGLYDMLGNVAEWCLDWYQESPLGFDVSKGPASGTYRVFRGGSFGDDASCCRCAYRAGYKPSGNYSDYGFRVSCSVDLN